MKKVKMGSTQSSTNIVDASVGSDSCVVLNTPNSLTMIRMCLIPVFVMTYCLAPGIPYWVSAFIFGLAAFTDWLDGYLARKLGQVSRLGAFLDPVADKLIVVVALVLLVANHSVIWVTLPALLIVAREVMISALREWMAEIGSRASVAVSHIGKAKTTLQMIAIFLLLAFEPDLSLVGVKLGLLLLFVAVVLTVWSMLAYIRVAWPSLVGENVASTEEGFAEKDPSTDG